MPQRCFQPSGLRVLQWQSGDSSLFGCCWCVTCSVLYCRRWICCCAELTTRSGISKVCVRVCVCGVLPAGWFEEEFVDGMWGGNEKVMRTWGVGIGYKFFIEGGRGGDHF